MTKFKLQDFLKEGRDAYLYHATRRNKLLEILKTNAIHDLSWHPRETLYPDEVNTERGVKEVYGVSLSRDYKFVNEFQNTKRSGIILVLNQRKLAQRHEIIPIDFFSGEGKKHLHRREAEEFVVGKIRNLKKYLEGIHIWMPAEDWHDPKYIYINYLNKIKDMGFIDYVNASHTIPKRYQTLKGAHILVPNKEIQEVI